MIRRSSLFRKYLNLPYLPVILAPFILFGGGLFTGRTLFWGLPALQFIPWQSYAWQQITEGMLPLWNPLSGMGAPLMANYQLAFFYPPTWLGYLFASIGGTPALAWAQTLLIPMHLAWAGIGMISLTRCLGFNKFAQTVSGLSFAMSGYFIARTDFYSMIWAGAWLPWILWSASAIAVPVKEASNPSRKIFLALIFCLTMQLLAGHAQLTWYTILLAGLWILTGGWVNGGWKRAVKSFLIFSSHGIIALCISAIQLIPTAEYLISSQRSTAVDFDLGLTYSFWPWRLLTLLAPNLFGNPGTGNFWGYASFWEDAIYIGIIPLVLGLSTLLKLGRKGDGDPYQPFIRFAWGIAFISFLFALGNNTPIFPFLYQYVPTFSMFNAPARWMVWFVFILSLLAGIGAMAWTRPVGRGLRRLKLLSTASLAVTMGAVITWVLLRNVNITFIESTAFLGIWATGTCFLTLKKPLERDQPGAEKFWQWATVGWLLVDLLWANWFFKPTVPVSLFSTLQEKPIAAGATGRVVMDAALEYDIKFHRFFRFSDYNPIEDWIHLRRIALPNLNLLPGDQFQYANNFDPLVPESFARWMKWIDHLPLDSQDQIYQLMNVSVRIVRDIANPLGVSAQYLSGDKRIRWYPCATFLSDEKAVWDVIENEVISSQSSILAQYLFLEDGRSEDDVKCSLESSARMNISAEKPGFLSVNIEAKGDGYLFLADSWYPGWSAWVDGVESKIYKADILFRAVFVPQGTHTVDFIYRPITFIIGGVITFIGLVYIVLIILFSAHRVK